MLNSVEWKPSEVGEMTEKFWLWIVVFGNTCTFFELPFPIRHCLEGGGESRCACLSRNNFHPISKLTNSLYYNFLEISQKYQSSLESHKHQLTNNFWCLNLVVIHHKISISSDFESFCEASRAATISDNFQKRKIRNELKIISSHLICWWWLVRVEHTSKWRERRDNCTNNSIPVISHSKVFGSSRSWRRHAAKQKEGREISVKWIRSLHIDIEQLESSFIPLSFPQTS